MRAGSESEGGASGGDSSSEDEDANKGKDLIQKLFEDGGGLYKYKVTALATALVVTTKGSCSTKSYRK